MSCALKSGVKIAFFFIIFNTVAVRCDLELITDCQPTTVLSTSSQSVYVGERNSPRKANYVDIISDSELQIISENLFKRDINNAGKYVSVNSQGKAEFKSKEDNASEPLFTVSSDVWNIPTIFAMKALYDNYEPNTKMEEVVTNQEIVEEISFLDSVLETPVMEYLFSALSQKDLVPNDYIGRRSLLRTMWFELYPRTKGKLTSSGFEHIFLSEIKKGKISGLHNWLYFFTQEEKKSANYLGYLNKIDLNDNNSIMKITFILDGIHKPVGSMFVSFSPELEMALYSLCFITRPNKLCPISLANNIFNIRTYVLNYNGKQYIGSAYPDI